MGNAILCRNFRQFCCTSRRTSGGNGGDLGFRCRTGFTFCPTVSHRLLEKFGGFLVFSSGRLHGSTQNLLVGIALQVFEKVGVTAHQICDILLCLPVQKLLLNGEGSNVLCNLPMR